MTSLQKCFLPPLPLTVQQTNASHILVLKNPKYMETIKNIDSISMHCISKKLFISENYQIKSIRSQTG